MDGLNLGSLSSTFSKGGFAHQSLLIRVPPITQKRHNFKIVRLNNYSTVKQATSDLSDQIHGVGILEDSSNDIKTESLSNGNLDNHNEFLDKNKHCLTEIDDHLNFTTLIEKSKEQTSKQVELNI